MRVPGADIRLLFDDLIGALLQKQGHVEAKRLGGLEIDHQIVRPLAEAIEVRNSVTSCGGHNLAPVSVTQRISENEESHRRLEEGRSTPN